MDGQNDSDHIRRVIRGDTAAFRFLVEKHKDMVYNIALRIIKNREDAEEIAQDAFLKAYKKMDAFREEAQFSTWLYRIAFNTAISKARKKKPEKAIRAMEDFDHSMVDEVHAGMEETNDQNKTTLIKLALDKLNECDFIMITLFYYKEASVQEISSITGLSASNVKVRLHRIRKKLYREIHELMRNKAAVNHSY